MPRKGKPHERRVAAEREACAKIADELAHVYAINKWGLEGSAVAKQIAEKIRARNSCLVVALEGVDGVGKSTHAGLLAERIPNSLVVPVPAPGALHYASIRESLKNGKAKSLPNFFQTLQAQNRHDWQARCYAEAASWCDCVILDRWDASLFAYGRAAGIEEYAIAEQTEQLLTPDLTVVLIGARHVVGPDAYERDSAFQERVAKFYRQWAAEHRDRAVEVDSTPPVEEVAEGIWAEVALKLQSR